jgi:nucleotide-binding universal stress UspA family protein
MRTPRKIVVATDFSAGADRALDVALAIAAHGKADVHLVHALEVPRAVFSPYALAIPDDLIAGARDAARKKLDAAAARVRARGLAVATTLGSVPASASVSAVAKEMGADLVVVGSRGHTGLKRLALGSVAELTVKESPVSVLTVRGEGHAEAPKVIVAGVDFSEPSERAVSLAADWARAFGAQLHLVHGLELTMPFLAPYEVTIPDALIDQTYNDARKRLADIAEKLRDVDVHTSVLSGTPHAALDLTAERVKADLIVTGSRGLRGLKHVLLGSVAERTLRHAPCSVLTVKSEVG